MFDWPLDLYESRAHKARERETRELGNSKEQRIQQTAEAGLREKARRRASSVGLPPLFMD